MNQINVNIKAKEEKVDGRLHSQFIEFLGNCIHEGIWVGEDSSIPNEKGIRKDVLKALKALEIPVLRWPGGCYADRYHWRDGIGDKKKRPVTYNENFGTFEMESNQFGTDEFMYLCEEIGAKPWLNINLLSGSVEEAVSWAEYCNREDKTDLVLERIKNGGIKPYQVEYWGIGNEAWAGGGNYTPKEYAADYRRFTTAFPTFTGQLNDEGEALKQRMIIVGPDGNKKKERKSWTRELFEEFARYRQPRLAAMDLHFYNWNLNEKDFVTSFEKEGWYQVIHGALEIEEVILEQYELIREGLNKIEPDLENIWFEPSHCDLYIGEWGNWHREAFSARPALYQQCTMRDAVTTAITLDIFHQHCDKVKLACAAQTVNVLNSLILTQQEKMLLTPNYYVFMMYKVHRNAVKIDCQTISGTAYEKDSKRVKNIYAFASYGDGIINLNIVNADYEKSHEVAVCFDQVIKYMEGMTLSAKAPCEYNSVENPDNITPVKAKEPEIRDNKVNIRLLPASVNVYRFLCE